jgi:hypothetical protein
MSGIMPSMSQKSPTYWVRSKQINEIGGFGRRPVPAEFKTLEKAKLYSRQLNLLKGAYHPGYFVEIQEDSPPTPLLLVTTGTGNS